MMVKNIIGRRTRQRALFKDFSFRLFFSGASAYRLTHYLIELCSWNVERHRWLSSHHRARSSESRKKWRRAEVLYIWNVVANSSLPISETRQTEAFKAFTSLRFEKKKFPLWCRTPLSIISIFGQLSSSCVSSLLRQKAVGRSIIVV